MSNHIEYVPFYSSIFQYYYVILNYIMFYYVIFYAVILFYHLMSLALLRSELVQCSHFSCQNTIFK